MQLDDFFAYRLAVASEAFSRNLAGVYATEFGLNREEWRLLFLLARAGRLSSAELGRRTTLDKVQVSRASQRLERKRLIIRDVHGTDRRLRVYTCTDAGRRVFEKCFPRVRERSESMLALLDGDDRVALERGIAALAIALGKGQTDTPADAVGDGQTT